MKTIFGSADEALQGLLRAVLNSGTIVFPRGLETKELTGVSILLANPRKRRITIKARKWNEGLAVGELCWHLCGSDELRQISYYSRNWKEFTDDGITISGSCYGKKIFSGSNAVNSQWSIIRGLLQRDVYTRQAVLYLYDIHTDSGVKKDVACTTSIQFLLRDGTLNCITTMRSNDGIWGLCYDLYIVTMLQEILACELGVDVGWYRHNVGSFHIYKKHYSLAEQIIAEALPTVIEEMAHMDNTEDIPRMLRVENDLRLGRMPSDEIQRLSRYWRLVCDPLIKRHTEVFSVNTRIRSADNERATKEYDSKTTQYL